MQCVLIQKEDPSKGKKEQWRCIECNALRARITRATQHDERLKKLTQLKPDARKKFMDDAKHLCGDKLTKCMMESIVWCRMRKESSSLNQKGEFEDWEEVQERFKLKPHILGSIERNSMFMDHPTLGTKQVWMPKLTFETAVVEEDSKTTKRELESSTKIKAAKKVKVEIIEQENKENGAEGQNDASISGVPAKPISESQLVRLGKIVEKFEGQQLKLTGLVGEAETPEMAEEIPKKALQASKDSLTALETTLGELKATVEKKFAKKGELKNLFEKSAEETKEAGKWVEKLTELLEDARA